MDFINKYNFLVAYDIASEITYSITQGNVGDAFQITSSKSGGVIDVKNKLDYEQTKEVCK